MDPGRNTVLVSEMDPPGDNVAVKVAGVIEADALDMTAGNNNKRTSPAHNFCMFNNTISPFVIVRACVRTVSRRLLNV